jgi:RND family efflux transporter MFP subunit
VTTHTRARLAFITLTISVGALVAACSQSNAEKAPAAAAPAPAEVRVVRADERDVPTVIRATGTFTADESSEVTPQVSGQVIATPIDVGAIVKPGQVLVRLDPRDATLRLQQAQASLLQAEAEAGRAKVEAERNAKLVQSGDISKSSYDRLTAQVAVAEAGVAQARAQVAVAQKALDDTTIRVPFAGHVSDRQVAIGEYVTTATKVATVVRIQPIKLNLQVPEADAARLRPGMSVRAEVSAHPNQVFEGKVSALNVALDPSSRAMTVQASFQNRDSRLSPGMFGTAEVRLSATERAMFIPAESVIPTVDGEASAVYVVDGGKARLRVVQTAETRDGAVRILSGLDAGAQVVTRGVDRLFDGAPVRVAQ